jgi:heptosyltransferase III
MRILFVTSNRLGDAVLSTGLLDHLIRTYPDARITIVCGPVAEGVFLRMPNREATIVLQKLPRGRHWFPLWAKTVTTLWDLVIDIRGSALSWLIPTRRRAVFHGGRGPKVSQLATLLQVTPPPLPVSWIGDDDRTRVAAMLPPGCHLIALAPTANWPPKVWAAERFAQAFRGLAVAGLQDARPVILGGPGDVEREMAAPLLRALPQAIDLVGHLSIPEVAAVLARSTIFIGNDSGLMHLAAATGVATIGLFGPTDAATYGPSGRCCTTIVGAAMEAISVSDVIAAGKRLLSSY